MNLRQKLGQMIGSRSHYEELHKLAPTGCVGAVSRHIAAEHSASLEGIIETVNDFRRMSPLPPLFFFDAEYGIFEHFRFGTAFPSMMALGATFSESLAYRMGQVVGQEGRAIGLGMIHSPVLDINSNPDNPIINIRSLGDNPEWVFRLAGAYTRGLQESGVMANAKHFPGHGDTSGDSHAMLPVVNASRETLLGRELIPYKELFKQGLAGIMTSHNVYPALLGPQEPQRLQATFSRAIITDLLRGELGFEGLAATDGLGMHAVRNEFDAYDSAVMAIQAGHDFILSGFGEPVKTLDALEAAVRSGVISTDQIDRSVRRLLSYKKRFGLLDSSPLNAEEAKRILNKPEHKAVAAEISQKAVTVMENRNLPWPAGGGRKMLLIATFSLKEKQQLEGLGELESEGNAGSFHKKMEMYGDRIRLCIIPEQPDGEDRDRVEKALSQENWDEVLFATFSARPVAYGKYGGTISDEQAALIRRIYQLYPQMTFLLMGNPYVLRLLPQFSNCLCAYSLSRVAGEAVAEVLYGQVKPEGRLPVHVNAQYPFQHGLRI
ncbi:MAG: beta-N-acetylglucosaminidase [Paenibacillus sp.]|nr:beta-N-acetylglucosaminidase [Paenibacillus sp.]